VMPGQNVLKKKSTAIGWILLIFGLIGLILSLILFPGLGYWVDAEDYYKLVILVLGGFLVGIPMLLAGAYLVATASSYNRKIDGALIQKAMEPSKMSQLATSSIGFCPNCGNQVLSRGGFCAKCGKKLG